jgi:hypothetical protein
MAPIEGDQDFAIGGKVGEKNIYSVSKAHTAQTSDDAFRQRIAEVIAGRFGTKDAGDAKQPKR